jgi:hypothetical protein
MFPDVDPRCEEWPTRYPRPKPTMLPGHRACSAKNADRTFRGWGELWFHMDGHIISSKVMSECGPADAKRFLATDTGRCIVRLLRAQKRPPCMLGALFFLRTEWKPGAKP